MCLSGKRLTHYYVHLSNIEIINFPEKPGFIEEFRFHQSKAILSLLNIFLDADNDDF